MSEARHPATATGKSCSDQPLGAALLLNVAVNTPSPAPPSHLITRLIPVERICWHFPSLSSVVCRLSSSPYPFLTPFFKREGSNHPIAFSLFCPGSANGTHVEQEGKVTATLLCQHAATGSASRVKGPRSATSIRKNCLHTCSCFHQCLIAK